MRPYIKVFGKTYSCAFSLKGGLGERTQINSPIPSLIPEDCSHLHDTNFERGCTDYAARLSVYPCLSVSGCSSFLEKALISSQPVEKLALSYAIVRCQQYIVILLDEINQIGNVRERQPAGLILIAIVKKVT